MALVNPYCAVADVQAEIKNSAAALQTRLEGAINAASRFVDSYLGRDYLQHDYTSPALYIYSFDGRVSGRDLLLPFTPIIVSPALVVKEGAVTLTVNVDYVVRDYKLVRLAGASSYDATDVAWAVGETLADAIILTGKFGYSQATSSSVPSGIPGNITRATILIAAALSGYDAIDVVGEDGTTTSVVSKLIPKTALTLLGQRRLYL